MKLTKRIAKKLLHCLQIQTSMSKSVHGRSKGRPARREAGALHHSPPTMKKNHGEWRQQNVSLKKQISLQFTQRCKPCPGVQTTQRRM